MTVEHPPKYYLKAKMPRQNSDASQNISGLITLHVSLGLFQGLSFVSEFPLQPELVFGICITIEPDGALQLP